MSTTTPPGRSGTALLGAPIIGTVLNRDFENDDDLGRVYTSRSFAGDALRSTEVACVTRSCAGAVTIEMTSTSPQVAHPTVITHRFHFIDRVETRHRLHEIAPEQPVATSTTTVRLPDGVSRDYFHFSVLDEDERFVTGQTIVYDEGGRSTRFPFGPALVSPLAVDHVDVRLDRDTGRMTCDVLFGVSVSGSGSELFASWEGMGVSRRIPLEVTADGLHGHAEVPLSGPGGLSAGEWVVVVVDHRNRLLAQTIWALHPAS